MQPEHRQRIESLFEAALDHSSASRRRWLASACGNHGDLHSAVLRLLNAHERAEGILEGSEPRLDLLERDEYAAPPPRRIGAYRLIRELGRGGMSTVYLGERDDRQFRQTVAVKVIRRGLDTPDLVARFCAERQILASLGHPNVARLLDGGATEDGLPYLAMEYVPGEPITEHCDRKRLTLEQRLRLFVTVARAVQYAHRNLVVHRDLKPSNILVTESAAESPGEGEIKLLDFGIAKLLDSHASPDLPPQTRPGLRLMTPEYASPEQIEGGSVTTATDVYGLGLVLYELLCGEHPFAAPAAFERRHARHEQQPRPPSSAVMANPGAADARRTQPERLRRKLRGDLDRIVLMALREEPERRYASAEQFAEDVERFLDGRPIRARDESLPYRMGKFATRNRWSVAVVVMFVFLLAGYTTALAVKERQVRNALEQASLEENRAEQVTEFLLRLFDAADPDDAETANGLYHLAEILRRAGRYADAEPLYREALAVRQRLLGNEHPDLAHGLNGLAMVMRDRGDFPGADSLYRQVLAMRLRTLGPGHPAVASTLNDRGVLLRDWGRYPEAESLLLQGLHLRRQTLNEGHLLIEQSLRNLERLYDTCGRPAQAAAYRQMLREG